MSNQPIEQPIDWNRIARERASGNPDCLICQIITKGIGLGVYPSHDGRKNCQSGSIASGGTVAHCTCDTCF